MAATDKTLADHTDFIQFAELSDDNQLHLLHRLSSIKADFFKKNGLYVFLTLFLKSKPFLLHDAVFHITVLFSHHCRRKPALFQSCWCFFPQSTAHNKICGCFWVTRSWFQEKKFAFLYFISKALPLKTTEIDLCTVSLRLTPSEVGTQVKQQP